MAQRRATRSRLGSRGSSLLEMSLVVSLLCLLLFGIIEFGYIMSFRGSMAQSAAEGARAGATANRPLVGAVFDNSTVMSKAQTATAQAVGGFDQQCNKPSGGLTCLWQIHDCGAAIGTDTSNPDDCLTVTLTYDWVHHPILPELPLISGAIPDSLRATSVVELNEP